MAESKLRDLSMDFSVKVIRMCDNMKGHHSLVNQLERSATLIGANIHEANYAHGKADFVAKFQIALKECYETEYWIELFVKSELIEREMAKELYNQCGTIRRILIASINTAKENIKMSDIKNIIKVEVPLIDKRYNGVNSNDTFKARLFKNQFYKPHYLPRDIEQLKAVDNIHALAWYDENALSYEEDRLFFKDHKYCIIYSEGVYYILRK
jgi:four helix bundle protein